MSYLDINKVSFGLGERTEVVFVIFHSVYLLREFNYSKFNCGDIVCIDVCFVMIPDTDYANVWLVAWNANFCFVLKCCQGDWDPALVVVHGCS